MQNGLDSFAEKIGNAVKTVPDVYDDALKPAAQESGKTLALIPRTVNAALAPLRQWIAQKEYNVAVTEKLLAQKLQNIPPEKIVTPEAYVAVPAFQAISYSMDSDTLRNLYANLLANSMNIDKKAFVHPTFVEIIKQLSPIDANVFSLIWKAELRPLINLGIKFSSETGGGSKIVFEKNTWITDYSQELLSISLDSLCRQNLITIDDSRYTNDNNYDIVRNTSDFIFFRDSLSSAIKKGQEIYEDKKIIYITELGKLFHNICVE